MLCVKLILIRLHVYIFNLDLHIYLYFLIYLCVYFAFIFVKINIECGVILFPFCFHIAVLFFARFCRFKDQQKIKQLLKFNMPNLQLDTFLYDRLCHTVDVAEILHQLRLIVYPII